ncbi:acyltransferase [Colwellia asteriadis]|uniref:Acyltransferase n=1 Tax=Colwellia asteriadis TaxID=517723 RepID=A0ABN1L5K2_9GAMM
MIIHFTNFIIQKIKSDPNYRLDEKITSIVLCSLLFSRLMAFMRGFLFQIIRLRKPYCMFKGSRVIVKHSAMLKLHGTLTIGSAVTIDCLGTKGIELGHNVNIPDNCFIRCTGVISDLGIGIKIGNNTGLGHNNFINGQGGVVIGDDVIVGPDVKFLSENHIFTNSNIPIRNQGVTRKGIVILSDVWIGANVTILDGVTIGKGCVIGAGSVVSKSIPDFSIAVGIPCRVVKKRENSNNE